MCLVENIVFYSNHKADICCQIRNTKARVILSYKINWPLWKPCNSRQCTSLWQTEYTYKTQAKVICQPNIGVLSLLSTFPLSVLSAPFYIMRALIFIDNELFVFVVNWKQCLSSKFFPFTIGEFFLWFFFSTSVHPYYFQCYFLRFVIKHSFAVLLFGKWAWTYRAFYQDLRYAKVNRINKTV